MQSLPQVGERVSFQNARTQAEEIGKVKVVHPALSDVGISYPSTQDTTTYPVSQGTVIVTIELSSGATAQLP